MKEQKRIAHNEMVANYWRGKVNDPEMVSTEVNWANWVRVKFDALLSIGFAREEALKITTANVSIPTINIHVSPNGTPDE